MVDYARCGSGASPRALIDGYLARFIDDISITILWRRTAGLFFVTIVRINTLLLQQSPALYGGQHSCDYLERTPGAAKNA